TVRQLGGDVEERVAASAVPGIGRVDVEEGRDARTLRAAGLLLEQMPPPPAPTQQVRHNDEPVLPAEIGVENRIGHIGFYKPGQVTPRRRTSPPRPRARRRRVVGTHRPPGAAATVSARFDTTAYSVSYVPTGDTTSVGSTPSGDGLHRCRATSYWSPGTVSARRWSAPRVRPGSSPPTPRRSAAPATRRRTA